jgi:hypothetical protein
MLIQPDSWMVHEVARQCVVRDANELLEQTNLSLAPCAVRELLRCECGDLACNSRLSTTHAEYEAVRSSGSQFLIALDHENPENACVVSEGDRYAVIDVVVGAARYAVRAQNPRHSWIEGRVPRRDPGCEGDAT